MSYVLFEIIIPTEEEQVKTWAANEDLIQKSESNDPDEEEESLFVEDTKESDEVSKEKSEEIAESSEEDDDNSKETDQLLSSEEAQNDSTDKALTTDIIGNSENKKIDELNEKSSKTLAEDSDVKKESEGKSKQSLEGKNENGVDGKGEGQSETKSSEKREAKHTEEGVTEINEKSKKGSQSNLDSKSTDKDATEADDDDGNAKELFETDVKFEDFDEDFKKKVKFAVGEEEPNGLKKVKLLQETNGGNSHRLERLDSQYSILVPKRTLAQCLKEALEKLEIEDYAWTKSNGGNNYLVTFVRELEKCEATLRELQYWTVGGVRGSSISVIPLNVHIDPKTIEKDEKEKNEQKEIGENEDKKEKREESDKIEPSESTIAEKQEKDKEKEKDEQKESEFKKSIKARLVVDQVVQQVRSNAIFTFDFTLLCVLASIIAALGLVENSSVILVASMLISPLMGPILAIVFGMVIQNNALWKLGLKTEAKGLAMCIVCGFVIGLVPCAFSLNGANWGSTDDFPTIEMSSRGIPRSLIVGFLIAVPSGAGVALSVLGGNVGSLVGVAISASLLPPAVNAGVFWALSLLSAFHPLPVVPNAMLNVTKSNMTITNSTSDDNTSTTAFSLSNTRLCPEFVDNTYTPHIYCEMSREAAVLGLISLLLTILNIVCIIAVGIIVLKIKEVAPIPSMVKRDFFKEDLTIARKSYKTVKKNSEDAKTLCREFIDERLKYLQNKENGIPKEELEKRCKRAVEKTVYSLCDSPEVLEFARSNWTGPLARNYIDEDKELSDSSELEKPVGMKPIGSVVHMVPSRRKFSDVDQFSQSNQSPQRKFEIVMYQPEEKEESTEEQTAKQEPADKKSLAQKDKENAVNEEALKKFDEFLINSGNKPGGEEKEQLETSQEEETTDEGTASSKVPWADDSPEKENPFSQIKPETSMTENQSQDEKC